MQTTAHISLPMAIIIGINAIVGATIFIAPAALQVTAGPAALITYLLVSIAALFMGLALARTAQLYPAKEVFYSYAHSWGGHAWGRAAAEAYCTGLIIALGLLTSVTSSYLQAYIPHLSVTLIGICLTALVVIANIMGASIARTGQIILMILTYVPIAVIIALCGARADLNNLVPFVPYGWQSIFQAIPIVIFGFFGIEAIPSLFSEIKNPQENVPKAITATIVLVALTYILFAGAIFLGLPRALFTSATTPLSTALLAVYPHLTWLTHIINWAIIITIIGTLHAMTWSLSSLISHTSHLMIGKKILSKKEAVLLVGFGIVGVCALIGPENIGVMFSLTSLGVVFAYATAMMPLLLKPLGRTKTQIFIATMGLFSALLVFCCAVLKLVSAYL